MTTKHLCAAALLLAAAPAAIAQAPTSIGSGQAYPSQQIKTRKSKDEGGRVFVEAGVTLEQ